MHPQRKQRLIRIIGILFGLGVASFFLLQALSENINLYLTPSELTAKHQALKQLTIGGMVKKGSVQKDTHSLGIQFTVTDFKRDLSVEFSGVLPALFREGQGVVMEGRLTQGGQFQATRVLAKHDERYMPPNIHPQKGSA